MSVNENDFEHKITLLLKEKLTSENPKVSFLIPKLNDFQNSEDLYIESVFYLAQSKMSKKLFCKFLLDLGSLSISVNSEFLLSNIFEKLTSLANETQNFQNMIPESYLELSTICYKYNVKFNWTIYLKSAIKQFIYLNNKVSACQSELLLGKYYLDNMKLFEAELHLENSYVHASNLIEPETNSKIEFELGRVYFLLAKYDLSKSFFSCSLINYYRLGNYPVVIEINNYLTLLHINANNIPEALKVIEKNLSLNKVFGNPKNLAFGYISKSLVYSLTKDSKLSLIFSNLAQKIYENPSNNIVNADKLHDGIHSGLNKEKLMTLYRELLLKSNKVA
ncbi:MAG: hypothetical protein JEY94_09605 [Melioribacteraceae bacterium]|nr:hypothetical protein [Melioribacteraceae bacterium]